MYNYHIKLAVDYNSPNVHVCRTCTLNTSLSTTRSLQYVSLRWFTKKCCASKGIVRRRQKYSMHNYHIKLAVDYNSPNVHVCRTCTLNTSLSTTRSLQYVSLRWFTKKIVLLKVLCEEDDETPIALLKDGTVIGEVRMFNCFWHCFDYLTMISCHL